MSVDSNGYPQIPSLVDAARQPKPIGHHPVTEVLRNDYLLCTAIRAMSDRMSGKAAVLADQRVSVMLPARPDGAPA